jgi:hypothetical protein
MENINDRREAYNKLTIAIQGNSGKTFKSRLSDCLAAIFGGSIIVVLILVLIVLKMVFHMNFAQSFRDIGPLLGIVGLIFLILALIAAPLTLVLAPIMALYYYHKPQKEIVCPFCGKSHKVYQEVASYVCDNCKNVFLLKPQANTGAIFAAECPICHSKWATDEDHGNTCCNSCGATLSVRNMQIHVPESDTICTTCNQKMPAGMYFCANCGEFSKDPNSDSAEEFSKTDNALTQMFAKPPRNNQWGIDSITQRCNSSFGFLLRTVWSFREIKISLENSKVHSNIVADFQQTIEQLEFINNSDPSIFGKRFKQYLDGILSLIFRHLITETNRYYFYFALKKDIEEHNKVFKSISNSLATIVRASKPYDTEIVDDWPNPIIVLEHAKSEADGGSLRHYAKAQNIDQIRRFVDGASKDATSKDISNETLVGNFKKLVQAAEH